MTIYTARTIVPMDDIKLMLKDINEARRFTRLNEIEQNFIINMTEKARCNSPLSEKQYKWLDKCYEKATKNG